MDFKGSTQIIDCYRRPLLNILDNFHFNVVEWINATKMGISPMISEYIRLAVENFGKLKITLIGDVGLYMS